MKMHLVFIEPNVH